MDFKAYYQAYQGRLSNLVEKVVQQNKNRMYNEAEENIARAKRFFYNAYVHNDSRAVSIYKEALPKIPWECISCGCSDELDMEGERICRCDTCTNGCESWQSRYIRRARRPDNMYKVLDFLEVLYGEIQKTYEIWQYPEPRNWYEVEYAWMKQTEIHDRVDLLCDLLVRFPFPKSMNNLHDLLISRMRKAKHIGDTTDILHPLYTKMQNRVKIQSILWLTMRNVYCAMEFLRYGVSKQVEFVSTPYNQAVTEYEPCEHSLEVEPVYITGSSEDL